MGPLCHPERPRIAFTERGEWSEGFHSNYIQSVRVQDGDERETGVLMPLLGVFTSVTTSNGNSQYVWCDCTWTPRRPQKQLVSRVKLTRREGKGVYEP